MSLNKLSWPGISKLFLDRESLVNDIPAGDRKIVSLFFQSTEEYEFRKDSEKPGNRGDM
jgi:hypothetical protein